VSIAIGLLLGAGLVLTASPWLWPRRTLRASRLSETDAFGVKELLVQAGLPTISPGTFAAGSALVGIAVAALTFALLPVAALALAAGTAATAAPVLIVTWRARRRRLVLRMVWPDVVDQLVSAVRSGLALPDGLATLSRSGPAATREPFRQFETEYRLTGNFSLCLDDLKPRLADPVADRILETLRMSREVGGSELTTVLRNLSAYLRQEAAVRAELEARQSWVMNAAKLGVAAPWVVLLLLATRPEAAAAYNSSGGVALIIGGLVVSIAAYRVMIGIGRLPEERRWFA